ncbi:hypothetical protein ELE36_13270 [Pseudolysobacter antarcticus]|uniref:Uncharacterized protein n=1 Tax=Pseudolysobacter antarcticus TaxID=2511995 RepID=A0A411HL84_9GAMM|nr:hypothetical protein [Pseudolysobacter antarcticus]QBB71248.1 hypothetical protein ELE36_13270 [Pseudolysobacter antarcticus]
MSTGTGDGFAMHKCQQQKRLFCLHHIARIDLFVCQKSRNGGMLISIAILNLGGISKIETAFTRQLPLRFSAPDQSADAKHDIANAML